MVEYKWSKWAAISFKFVLFFYRDKVTMMCAVLIELVEVKTVLWKFLWRRLPKCKETTLSVLPLPPISTCAFVSINTSSLKSLNHSRSFIRRNPFDFLPLFRPCIFRGTRLNLISNDRIVFFLYFSLDFFLSFNFFIETNAWTSYRRSRGSTHDTAVISLFVYHYLSSLFFFLYPFPE